MNSNAEMIQKSIDTTDFTSGGAMNAKQQDKFVTLIRKYARFLPKARMVRMTQITQEVDKLHLGEPVTELASEDADSGNTSSLKYNKFTLNAVKLRSAWNITTEAFQNNIEGDRFEDTVMDVFSQRMAHDLELLAFRGDTSIVGTTALDRLLKATDGWIKTSDSAHVLDAGGAFISKEMFMEAKRMMPKEFRKDPNLRWLCSDTLRDDWVNYLSERGTALGDKAIGGQDVAPLSIEIEEVPIIPDDLDVTVSFATPARRFCTGFSPYIVTAAADNFTINVNAVGAVVITLPVGTKLHTELADSINDQLVTAYASSVYRNVARTTSDGRLYFQSPTVGAASTINITAIDAALGTELGLATGVSSGAAAAATNTVPEGTCFWLVNPMNLVWGLLDGTRSFAKFNERFDRVEATVFNQVDFDTENFDAMVFVKNVRINPLTTGLS